jgi:integrase
VARQTQITIAEFVGRAFVPEHVATKKLSGRRHFVAMLKHILGPEEVARVFCIAPGQSKAKLESVPDWPYLGHLRLLETRPDDVQRLITAALARGYSTQTVKHIRNVVRSIFVLAARKGWFSGDNPASLVTLPGMTRTETHTLTLAQARNVFALMQYPEKHIALFATLTSMNVAEICGLQWKHVNPTEAWSHLSGEAIPPKSIAVRQQWYLGELGGVNGKSRFRNVPIPEPLVPILGELSRRAKFTGPDDFVLVSPGGTPVDGKTVAARRLKPIGRALGMPWLCWHVFRRTYATLPRSLGIEFSENPRPAVPADFAVGDREHPEPPTRKTLPAAPPV